MAQAYLDSAGNVNPALADDLNNFVTALRQRAVIQGNPGALPAAAAAGAVVAADPVTGLPNVVTAG